jgi:hypothetical protein
MSNYTRKNNKRAANDPNINRAAHYFNDRKKAGNEIEYSEALTYAGFMSLLTPVTKVTSGCFTALGYLILG